MSTQSSTLEAYWRNCATGSSGLAGDERYAGGGRALDKPCGSVLYEPELGRAMLILEDMVEGEMLRGSDNQRLRRSIPAN